MRELSLNVMDIVQNSISAEANLVEIFIEENTSESYITISIIDDGVGMTKGQVKRAISPFYTTKKTRTGGFGVPFFKMAAEITGGNFKIESERNKGTKVIAKFITSSVNMIPLGDINSTIALLIRCNPEKDFLYKRIYNEKNFVLNTKKLRETLEEVPINSNEVMCWINNFLIENTQNIYGGVY